MELRQEPGRKLALPAIWIRDTLLDPKRMGGLNPEARDIAIVCAETGAQGAEVVDLAPEDIMLAHDIPHLRITIVEEGEMRRELKNVASRRQIPLLGQALEAMRRHPLGFPRYCGKATYSVASTNTFGRASCSPRRRRAPLGLTRSVARASPTRIACCRRASRTRSAA